MSAEPIEHQDAIWEIHDALPAAQCQAVIQAFEAESRKGPGIIHRVDGTAVVDPTLKRSTDFLISPDSGPTWLALDRELVATLHRCVSAYVARYPWIPKRPTTFCGFQIQRTEVGEYFGWHADEDARRRLALILYLNDDFEGGGTEFEYQQLTIRPRRGTMLMFPPYWTHVHRGQAVERGCKYIATCFLLSE